MKQKDKKMSALGKSGAKKRWASRYATLQELSKLVDKEFHNYLMSWPTEHLERLAEHYRKNV